MALADINDRTQEYVRDGSKNERSHDTDNFDIGNEGHGSSVVLLGPHLDLAGNSRDLVVGGIRNSGGWCGEEGREDVGPCVVEGVEEGKDRIWDQGSYD